MNSLGYQKKGWTDGEIGVEWMKDFHEKTKEKAAGRARLLLVDGHNSHYTRGFLEFARDHDIHVLCYPAHATHVYQGLDVAVFGVVKTYWSEERDKWERERKEPVTKENFLGVYGAAHIRALTPDTIKSAFRKTGAWPFNPGIITEEMMAPSLETSSTGSLPLANLQKSPVRLVSRMFRDLAAPPPVDEDDAMDVDSPAVSSRLAATSPPRTPTRTADNTLPIVRSTYNNLQSTSAAFLATPGPVASSSRLPEYNPLTISPIRTRNAKLLNLEPATDTEHQLQEALADAETRYSDHKATVGTMQATIVLEDLHNQRLQTALAFKEQKKTKKKGNERLNVDGKPKLLSAPWFIDRVVEHTEARDTATSVKAVRKTARDRRDSALKIWEHDESARVGRNAAHRSRYEAELAAWNQERSDAKSEHRKSRARAKPILKGRLEAAVPKPKVKDFIPGSDSDGDEDEDDLDEGEDEGEDIDE